MAVNVLTMLSQQKSQTSKSYRKKNINYYQSVNPGIKLKHMHTKFQYL